MVSSVLLMVACSDQSPVGERPAANDQRLTAGADELAGMGGISGTLTATEPFTAARVYIKNHDKSMLYTVFSSAGQYRAINLMPGGYEIWAEQGGLRSEHHWMRIQGAADVQLDLMLKPGPDFALTLKDSTKPGPQFGRGAGPDAQLVSYEEMYPPGPAYDIVETTCIRCHGQSFLPSHRMDRAQWHAMVAVMLDPRGQFVDDASARSITAGEHGLLTDYLTANFGPASPAKVLRLDIEYPLDEEVLAKAMFIEYLLPLAPGTDLSGRSTNEPGKHRTHEPHIDNSGNIWGTNGIIGISRVDPRTAQWSHFPYGTDLDNPAVDMYGKDKSDPASVWSNIFGHGMTVDANGHVFWIEFQGQHVGRLDPETGAMVRYHMDPRGVVEDEQGVLDNARGHSPDLDAEQNVWFTVIRGNKIGKWDRRTEKIKLWEIPTPHSFPYGIEIDQNGEIWFAELYGCKVGRFNPATEEFTEYPSFVPQCAINRLMADSKGIIWYSVTSSGVLGRIDPRTGDQKEYDILPFSKVKASRPYGIIADQNDQVWFGDGGLGGALIRFDPATEEFTYYPLPRQADNPNLDRTGDGAIIFSTRSSRQAALGIFYPDVGKMTGYGVYR